MVSSVESDKARKEKLVRHRQHDTLQRTIKPHLQSSKVGALVFHVCDNAHVFSIVLIITQLLPFL